MKVRIRALKATVVCKIKFERLGHDFAMKKHKIFKIIYLKTIFKPCPNPSNAKKGFLLTLISAV